MTRRTPRKQHDFYETPPHYLTALASKIGYVGGQVYEPCVGNRAISDWIVAKERLDRQRRFVKLYHPVRLWTNDIDPKREASWHLDARSKKAWTILKSIDWTITNPPFEHIERILSLAIRHSTNVISLARLSFLEPTITRRTMFKQLGTPDMVIVLPRYQFSKPSKDTMTCCWVGWGPSVPQYWGIDLTVPPK